ncbi:MAG: transketolase family protein [Lachnospiraceae bacterium]|jgi:transketolase|nr:transketolase family protein [Lachnospiraceae bacterium]
MRQFELEKKTTRDAFGAAVFELAKEDPKILAIGADTTGNLGMKDMAKEMPDRVINIGIAEQNMMCVASGLAATGYRVFGGSFAPFISMRSLEQFRTFCAYPHLNVVMAGGMGGLSAANEGVTHQCPEDLSIMRTIAGNVVVYPADTASTRAVVKALGKHEGPAYIRLGKFSFRKVFDENYKFEVGKANILEEGKDVAILACGAVIYRALQAADVLREQGIQATVVDCSCIKPLDEETVLAVAEKTGCVVTVEDSTIIGALGGAVAELLGENLPTPMKRVGIKDCFTESGDLDLLMDKYGIGVQDIVDGAKAVMAKK